MAAAGIGVLWHRLARIRAPTLIVHGSADRVVPVRAASVLEARIPDARVEIIEGAGHALVLERPREVTDISLDFLALHDSSRCRGVVGLGEPSATHLGKRD